MLDEAQLKAVRDLVLETWGRVDILVNAAGGNIPEAVVFGDRTFFNIPRQAFEQVVALNLTGTLLPCQIFGEGRTKKRIYNQYLIDDCFSSRYASGRLWCGQSRH